MDTAVRKQLLETLAKIDRPSTICASGVLPSILPGLEVAGVGEIALPLNRRQAEAIKEQSHQAPYGKGTQTLVDTEVRRVWEIDADQIVLANAQWNDVLTQAISTAQSELGLENQQLEAHLYKLLLYETGSFFLAHRDGEKLDRMVATLVIALPSAHVGGSLIVRHEGREETVDFSSRSQFQTQFAAFYSDCEHEIRPVTSGFRLALVYNLTLAKARTTISAPTSGQHIAAAAQVLRQWINLEQAEADPSQPATPSKMAVLLDHQYTQAGLTCDTLKGIDRARADVLFAAARESGCDAYLALVTLWESGSADPSGEYEGSYYEDDDEDDDESDYEGGHVMGEVFDGSLSAEHFSDAEGNLLAFGEIPIDEDEIVSNQPLHDRKPDEEDFEGFTGNAGMTLDRWYRSAAIVLWPADSRFEMLCEAGAETAVGGLEQMIRRWKLAKKSEQQVLKQPCLEFASRIIAHWPEREFSGGYYSGHSDKVSYVPGYNDEGYEDDDDLDDEDLDDEGANDEGGDDEDHGPGRVAEGKAPRATHTIHALIHWLKELDDVSLISAWIRGVLAKDATVNPGQVLGDLCHQHGWDTFRAELLELFEKTSNETLERHARLLADWSQRKDKDADRKRLCSELARQLVEAVERWDAMSAARAGQARSVNRRELLPPLTQALLALRESELLDRLLTYVLDRPAEFDLTTVQVPAMLSLEGWLKRNVKHSSSPLNRWLTSVSEQLEFRKSQPPQKPADWRRDSKIDCTCADCKTLGQFLDDPNKQIVRLPLAENRRRHLHQIIDRQKLDLTHVTERRGRPFTLVCTKTSASYERALKAHHVDLEQLSQVQKLLDWHGRL